MKVVKALLLDEDKDNINYFREVFSRWNADLTVVTDVENSLIRINILKPNVVLISSDLSIAYDNILTYLFGRNYQVIIYGKKNVPDKWKQFPTFSGYFPAPIDLADFKKFFRSKIQGNPVKELETPCHIDLVTNNKVGVVELEGNLTWEAAHEIKYKLISYLRDNTLIGAIFIFHQLENSDTDMDEMLGHLFSFLQEENFSPAYIKYLTLDERVLAFLKRDDSLRRIEQVESYADAYMKIQSLTMDKRNIGTDLDFIRENIKLVESVYDDSGNLIKRAGSMFSKEDITALRTQGIYKLYYARELSSLGVQVNTLEDVKENIEEIIMQQVDSSEDLVERKDIESQGKMVMIIEDDPASQKILTQILGRMKYEYKVAGNGAEGLQECIRFNPNLIILDLMMPEMNGIEFIKKYRQVRQKGAAPIIVLSAVSRSDVIQTVLKLGAKDYILKPVNLKSLVEKIQRHIQ